MKKLLVLLLLASPAFAQTNVPASKIKSFADETAAGTCNSTSLFKIFGDVSVSKPKFCNGSAWTSMDASTPTPPFTTSSANPSTVGVLRCANNENCVSARNAANGANFSIKLNTSNEWQFDAPVATSASGNGEVKLYDADASNYVSLKSVNVIASDTALNINTLSMDSVVEMVVFDFTTDTATGDGKFYFVVPAKLNGMNLVGVNAQVITAGTTNSTTVQIARCATAASGNACSGTVADMLSTRMTIDTGENSTDTAAAAAVIDTANDDVSTGQIIRVDVDTISTTAAKGLIVTLVFRMP